jgi:hypothetical protein
MAQQKVTYSARVTLAAEPAPLTVEVWREDGREGVRLSAGPRALRLEQWRADTGELRRAVEREGVEERETAGFLQLFLEAVGREVGEEARARLGQEASQWTDEDIMHFLDDLVGASSIANLFGHFAEGRDMDSE